MRGTHAMMLSAVGRTERQKERKTNRQTDRREVLLKIERNDAFSGTEIKQTDGPRLKDRQTHNDRRCENICDILKDVY